MIDTFSSAGALKPEPRPCSLLTMMTMRNNDQLLRVKYDMTYQVTQRLCATALADERFPGPLLPPLQALPYQHVGHQVLLDYPLFAKTLWCTALAMRDECRWLRSLPARLALTIGIGLVVVGLALVVSYMGAESMTKALDSHLDIPGLHEHAQDFALIVGTAIMLSSVLCTPLGLVAAALVVCVLFLQSLNAAALVTVFLFPAACTGWATYAVSSRYARWRACARIAEIKDQDLVAILRGETPPSAQYLTELQRYAVGRWGDGALADTISPVLIAARPEDPFPGFGWLQDLKRVVCPPRQSEDVASGGPVHTEDGSSSGPIHKRDLVEAIYAALEKSIDESALPNVNRGRVVVVDGDSIMWGSRWLDSHKRPLLFCKSDEMGQIDEPRTTDDARLYFAFQVFLHEYLMSITFFVRVFMVGNAAACEVCLCTLGPSCWSLSTILRKIHQQRETPTTEIPRNVLNEIAMIDPSTESVAVTWTGGASRLDGAHNPGVWPGMYFQLPNWRRLLSAPTSEEFFKIAECSAAIQTIFNRMYNKVLVTMKLGGYDISAYVDKNGQIVTQTLNFNTGNVQTITGGMFVGGSIVQESSSSKEPPTSHPRQSKPKRSQTHGPTEYRSGQQTTNRRDK